MPTKMNFSPAGTAVFDDNGEYSVAIQTKLPHRFSLVDGKVVDKYNGVSDEEVKLADHQAAIALADERGEPHPPAL